MNRSATPPGIALRGALTFLPLIALAISSYLAWLSFAGGAGPVGCGEGDVVDCLHVLKSRWATWLGLPVAVPAAVVYAAMLVSATLIGPWFSSGVRRAAWLVLLALAVVVAGAALWFIGLQLFLLDKLCVYCLAAHACGLLAAALVFWRAPIVWEPAPKQQRLKISSSMAANLVTDAAATALTKVSVASAVTAGATGLLLVTALVVGHLVLPQVTYVVETADNIKPVVVTRPVETPTPAATTPTKIANDSVHTALYPPQEAAGEATPPTEVEEEVVPTESAKPSRSEALNDDDDLDSEIASDAKEGSLALEPLFPVAKKSQPEIKANGSASKNPFPAKDEDEAELSPLRTISLLKGEVELKLPEQMIIGPPTARHVVVKIFDYTCPHCRLMHRQLEEARHHFGDQMAIVLLPVPLNKGCNPLVQATHPHHDFACLYARMAWAVWKHKPNEFAKFHEWLLTGADAPAPGVARLHLARMLGNQLAEDAPSEAWVDERIKACVEVYGQAGAERIPKLLVGDTVFTGETNSSEELIKLLTKYFAAPTQPH